MIDFRKEKDVRKTLVFTQLALLYLPNWKLFEVHSLSGTIPASMCYIFSIVFIPFLIKKIKKIEITSWYVVGYFIFTIMWAIINATRYGMSKGILHWIFGLYLLIIIWNVGQDFSTDEWIRILGNGACIFAIVHLIYMFCNYSVVVELLERYFVGGPYVGCFGALLPSVTRGGRNLDCTWLALGGFFVKGKKKIPYVLYAALMSFVGASRVGVIAVTFVIIWSLLYDKQYKASRCNLKWYIFGTVVFVSVLFMTGLGQAFLGRMSINIPAPAEVLGISGEEFVSSEISVEIVLSGRKAIWEKIPQMIKDNLFGYGAGNAMVMMKKSYGFAGFEDVVHNVFLQWLVDEGILGGLYFISLAVIFLRRQWSNRPRFFNGEFDGYFATYLILSMVQFHGAEALMLAVLGIYLHQTRQSSRLFSKEISAWK